MVQLQKIQDSSRNPCQPEPMGSVGRPGPKEMQVLDGFDHFSLFQPLAKAGTIKPRGLMMLDELFSATYRFNIGLNMT